MKLNENFQKGASLFENQDYENAIVWFDKALKSNPDHVQSLHTRALAKAKLQNYDGAMEDFKKALRLSPDNAIMLSDRALIYHFMGDTDKSMADFDLAVKLEPENGYRYASRAFIKDRNGDLEGALKDYNKAIALDPEDAISINNRGMVEEKMGYTDKAKKSFEVADELQSILTKNDIAFAPKNEEVTSTLPPSLPNDQLFSPNRKNKTMSTREYLKTLTAIFTKKKDFNAFIDFCKRFFKR